jgi:transcriptional regulator with XRE-family HTH domain
MTDERGPARGAAPPVAREVGARVRTLRLDRRMTLDQLAEGSGVSRRMITMLEAGETNASIGTLDKLAGALGTDLPSLVSSRPVLPFDPSPSGSVQPLWQDDLGSSARLLVSHRRTSVTELWQWRLAPGARYDADPDPPGSEEMILVGAGRLVVEVGEERYRLEADGYLRLPTHSPYAYVNPGTRPTRFIRVVVSPAAP